MKQYDVSFTVLDFLQVKKANWEIESIHAFLLSGIRYRTVEEAFRLGIVNLDAYRNEFDPAGVSFDDYLDAYKLEIPTAEEYLRYQEGYERIRIGLGIGFVADGIPVGTANFNAPILHASIEYFISEYQRKTWKYGIETGFSLFYGIVPVYYLQANAYVGNYPLMGKIAVGGIAEVFVGGTVALGLRAGVEFFESFEFVITAMVLGNQPSRYYSIDRWGEEPTGSEDGINYPFYAVEFVYKL